LKFKFYENSNILGKFFFIDIWNSNFNEIKYFKNNNDFSYFVIYSMTILILLDIYCTVNPVSIFMLALFLNCDVIFSRFILFNVQRQDNTNMFDLAKPSCRSINYFILVFIRQVGNRHISLPTVIFLPRIR